MKCRPPRSSSSVPLGSNGERTERSTSKLSIETYRHSAVKKIPAILRLLFFPFPRAPSPFALPACLRLGFAFHLIENALVNSVQQDFAPRAPISLRINRDAVPGVAFESSTRGSFNKPEFAAGGSEVAVEVWCVDPAVDAELAQRWRLGNYVEGKTAWLVPTRDRLDERAR